MTAEEFETLIDGSTDAELGAMVLPSEAERSDDDMGDVRAFWVRAFGFQAGGWSDDPAAIGYYNEDEANAEPTENPESAARVAAREELWITVGQPLAQTQALRGWSANYKALR